MASIVDVPEIRASISLMSVEFYHASTEIGWIDENTELLRGVPVYKMSKSPEHEYTVEWLEKLLSEHAPDGSLILKERPFTTFDSEPEPDLMVVKGETRDFRSKHPTRAELVVEVAISSEVRDREKATIYAEADVKEYWLVLPEKKIIEFWSNPTDGVYLDHQVITEDLVSSESVSGFSIKVPHCFS